ncbi:MAG: hypothetical protein WED11_01865, partial [Natronospirillum sp.]
MTNPFWEASAALPLARQHSAFCDLWPHSPLLLEAEPGAGKSTLVPLWALALTPPEQAVWLIQPRILATRAVASRLAYLHGSALGQTVGYQVPYGRKLNAQTRLQV